MKTYHVLGVIDANVSVTVEADSPEAAAELAWESGEMNPSVCHYCSRKLNVGELYITRVHDEHHNEVWTDERANLSLATDAQLRAELKRRKAKR